MKTDNSAALVTNYRLQYSTPDFVFEWLQNNHESFSNLPQEDSESLFKMLISRDEKLINLGLALYCPDPDICSKLFSTADETLKKAILSGIGVADDIFSSSWINDYLGDLLSEFNEDLLATLLNNKNIPEKTLIDLYEKKKHFEHIDEETWIRLCYYTTRNERIATPYESDIMDSDSEYKYNKVFVSAWRLFDTFPTTAFAAKVLSLLGENLVVSSVYKMDVEQTIKRWIIEDQDSEYFEDTRAMVARLNQNFTDKFKKYKDSDDVALRRNYYSNFHFPKPENVIEFFDKDGEIFLDAALKNHYLFADPAARDALSQACWENPDEYSLMIYPNIFNRERDKWANLHPEWFEDEFNGDLPFKEIEDYDVRLEKRVEHLSKKVVELNKVLLDKESMYDEDEKTTIEYIKGELAYISSKVKKSKPNNTSLLVFVSVVAGYLLAQL